MRQIIALILVSVFSFLGIIFIKEYRLGQLEDKKQADRNSSAAPAKDIQEEKEKTPKSTVAKQQDTPELPVKDPAVEAKAKTPEEIIGVFAIDKELSQQKLVEQEYGSALDAEALLATWPLVLIEFDGKAFQIDTGENQSKQYFLPTEQSDTQLTIPLNLTGNGKPTPYTMTWDEKGFWLSYQVKKPGSDEQFEARIRFKKVN